TTRNRNRLVELSGTACSVLVAQHGAVWVAQHAPVYTSP
ncbi:MAG: hypothetical protein ACI9XB_003578, partial [Gammaproteobacteria bacterium]